MKTLKTIAITVITCCLIGCVSTAVAKSEFAEKTHLSMAVPMRVFTWVKSDGAKTFMNDYAAGKIIFNYSEENTFMVKVEKTDGVINTIWGKQLIEIDEEIRSLVITAFISSCYSIADNNDGVESAFNVLNQIFSDPMYAPLKNLLPQNLKDGLDAYRTKTDWQIYKAAYFSTANNTFVILK
ncbi:hypothetical protein HMPREF1221_01705 [Treponema socranskii subsp. paredis ATCC 35535]|nr:hypothetical protein HMPREF1221_01705 [Treponema socranskii subsp. paredis ATCC 35535]